MDSSTYHSTKFEDFVRVSFNYKTTKTDMKKLLIKSFITKFEASLVYPPNINISLYLYLLGYLYKHVYQSNFKDYFK